MEQSETPSGLGDNEASKVNICVGEMLGHISKGFNDKQETRLTVLLSFLLASSAQSPAAEGAWCHSTDSDGAEPPSAPARTDYAACAASS